MLRHARNIEDHALPYIWARGSNKRGCDPSWIYLLLFFLLSSFSLSVRSRVWGIYRIGAVHALVTRVREFFVMTREGPHCSKGSTVLAHRHVDRTLRWSFNNCGRALTVSFAIYLNFGDSSSLLVVSRHLRWVFGYLSLHSLQNGLSLNICNIFTQHHNQQYKTLNCVRFAEQ